MNKKIATLGSLTIDLFVQPEETKIFSSISEHGKEEYLALPHGGKIYAEHIQTHLGGGASNTATTFQNLKIQTCIFAGVGDDTNADIILSKIKEKHIDTSQIQHIKNTKSGFSLILNSFDGERTVIFTSEANTKFSQVNKKILEEENLDAFHLCHNSSDSAVAIMQEITDFFEAYPEKILSWNPGKEAIEKGIEGNKKILCHTDFLYLNTEEAEEFTRLSAKKKFSQGEERRKQYTHLADRLAMPDYVQNVTHIAQKFLDAGVKTIIITDGRRGAQIFTKEQSFFVPCVPGERVDTLGAGDSFASTLTAMVLHGNPLSKSAQYASMMAANVVAHKGAQDGILSFDALQQTRIDQIQIVPF